MNPKFNISGSTRFGGLIGRGISHLLSPLIHNTSAALLGLDVVYLPFDCAESPNEAFFKTMLEANCYGFNVTVPYKETIAHALSGRETQSVSLRTCNTLIPRSTYWDVTSTDADGFIAGLSEMGSKLEDFSAFIFLGYGGAAKALIAKLQSVRPQQPIFVLLRNHVSASEANGVDQLNFSPAELEILLQKYPEALLIQCTSAPLRGDDLSQFCPALKSLRGGFVDLVYGSPSALLAEAQKRNIPCQDGIPMLIHQALLSQKLWWGRAANFSDIKSAVARQS